MMRLLITGANRGVGFALVTQCANRGDWVIAGCRSPEKAKELEALVSKFPRQITILKLDVTNQDDISNAADQVSSQVEGLDVLINNAAVHYTDVPLSEVKEDVLLKTLHVNAVGPIMVAQKFLDLLGKGENPRIVNISSEAGSISKIVGFRGYAYYISKATENMFTRCLAFDPESQGITVISMHPGWVRTDMGGPIAHLSPEESAIGILTVTDQLKPEDNGKFLTWEGIEHPW
jgi:NAD(P)-dependent dehydrogenase (short-subunit alcohol dehydrogenase family)